MPEVPEVRIEQTIPGPTLEPPVRTPSFLAETVPAAFRLDNSVVSAIDAMTRPVFEDDPDFDLHAHLKADKIEDQDNLFAGDRKSVV